MNDNRDHLRALLAAYNEAVGIELDLDYGREKVLRELDKKGLTPDDMRAVMRELKRLVASDDKRYTDASLLFENAVGTRFSPEKINRFQGLALLLRKRRRPGSLPPKTPTAAVSEEEWKRQQAAVKALAAKLREEMGR